MVARITLQRPVAAPRKSVNTTVARAPVTRAAPQWTRIVLVALAFPQVVTGLWAVANPGSWYRSFPGFGPYLIAAEPPYNQHLATDAGAGFLATGVMLLVAAAWADRRLVAAAGLSLTAFAVPHFVYHAANPAPGLTDAQNLTNVVTLFVGVVLPIAVTAAALRGGKNR